jgi:hypothetical protein
VQVTFIACACLLSIFIAMNFLFRNKPVYLVDFSVYKPPAWCVPGLKRGTQQQTHLWTCRLPLVYFETALQVGACTTGIPCVLLLCAACRQAWASDAAAMAHQHSVQVPWQVGCLVAWTYRLGE